MKFIYYLRALFLYTRSAVRAIRDAGSNSNLFHSHCLDGLFKSLEKTYMFSLTLCDNIYPKKLSKKYVLLHELGSLSHITFFLYQNGAILLAN